MHTFAKLSDELPAPHPKDLSPTGNTLGIVALGVLFGATVAAISVIPDFSLISSFVASTRIPASTQPANASEATIRAMVQSMVGDALASQASGTLQPEVPIPTPLLDALQEPPSFGSPVHKPEQLALGTSSSPDLENPIEVDITQVNAPPETQSIRVLLGDQ